MKVSTLVVTTILIVIWSISIVPLANASRHLARSHHNHRNNRQRNHQTTEALKEHEWKMIQQKMILEPKPGISAKLRGPLDTMEVAGSTLPDCSHACGSCRPCKLVMVTFICSSLEEAETCPMAYKCMCHSKSYPVP